MGFVEEFVSLKAAVVSLLGKYRCDAVLRVAPLHPEVAQRVVSVCGVRARLGCELLCRAMHNIRLIFAIFRPARLQSCEICFAQSADAMPTTGLAVRKEASR